MDRARRKILQLLGISALAAGTKPMLDAFASSSGNEPHVRKGDEALSAKQWGMVIDTRKLESPEDVEHLIEACHNAHNVPHLENKNHEIKWIWETEYKHAFPGKFNKFLNEAVEERPFLVLCNHCENPPCVKACPTQATFKRRDGIVLMDFHRCIGCRFCMAACPFGSRSFNFRDPRPAIAHTNLEFPTRTKGVVEKCNFCAERLAVGKQPYCVEASHGAIVFGDLYDENSDVRHLLKENYTIRRKQNLGTEPSVYYIV